MTSSAHTGSVSGLAARAAAIASVGAAAIHFAVMPSHVHDWLPAGLFFASIATFQLMWAVLAWNRPPAVLLAVGILVNTGLAVLWVMSRTGGIPVGPHAGEPEMVQAAGICVLLLECYVVMGAAWSWSRSFWAEPVSGLGSTLVLLGANTVVVAAVTVGVASGLHSQHHHGAPVVLPAANVDEGHPHHGH